MINIFSLYSKYEIIGDIFILILVFFISLHIFKKAIKYYKLSNYRGIKIFGTAFLFFAFVSLMSMLTKMFIYYTGNFPNFGFQICVKILSSYFSLVGTFYIVYSLVWKDIEASCKTCKGKFLVLHIIAFLIAIINLFYSENYEVFIITQLVVLLYGIDLSHQNYLLGKKKSKNSFYQLYHIALILMFVQWALYYIASFLTFKSLNVYIQFVTIFIFIIFLYLIENINNNS